MFYLFSADYDRGRYCHVCRDSYEVLIELPAFWAREDSLKILWRKDE